MRLKITVWILAFIMLSSVTAWASLSKTQVSQLYVSIFGRASEGEGNVFWQAQPAMATAAMAMLDTQAAKNYFGSSLDSNLAFIEHIYLNTLNKTLNDDYNGIRYWVSLLETGLSRGEVVAALIAAIETYGPGGDNYNSNDAAAVVAYNQFRNRVEVSDYMADNIWYPPVDWQTSTSFSHGLIVTNEPATVITAMVVVNSFSVEPEPDPDPDPEPDPDPIDVTVTFDITNEKSIVCYYVLYKYGKPYRRLATLGPRQRITVSETFYNTGWSHDDTTSYELIREFQSPDTGEWLESLLRPMYITGYSDGMIYTIIDRW